MSQEFLHTNLLIGEVTKSSYMFGLADTGSGLNLVNLDCHQSVAECNTNLVLKFEILKDLDDKDPFNINGVDRGKESEQGKGGIYVT